MEYYFRISGEFGRDLLSVLVCGSIHVCCFLFLSRYYLNDTKMRSWIVTGISSFFLSLCGLFWVFKYVTGIEDFSRETIYSDNPVSRDIIIFFMTTQFFDLLIGYFSYYDQLNFLTSYVHHIFYMGFMLTLLISKTTNGFIYCFFEEIPTFLLALGTLVPSLRSDIFFGLSYLVTRIIYHVTLTTAYMLCMWESVYWKICLTVTVLHVYWMYKWTISMLKKAHKRKRTQ